MKKPPVKCKQAQNESAESKTHTVPSFDPPLKKRPIYHALKAVFDPLFGAMAVIVASPIFAAIAIAIKLDDPGPVIYKQTRAGKGNSHFTMYKFRSMHVNADARLKELEHLNEKDGPVFKITNDPRVTRVGRFIRKYSLDELPQLFNIAKGDMSFIGPRPPLIKEVEQYTPHQMKRLAVKPGLTCYWQVNGRSDILFDEWIEMDIRYIQECSVWTDIKILFKTIPAVLFGKGAY